jgi:hypothetical protein
MTIYKTIIIKDWSICMRKTRIILISLILLTTLSSCDTVNTGITTPSPSLTEAAIVTAVIPSPTDVPSETPIQIDTATTTTLPTKSSVMPTPTATAPIAPTPTENPGPRDIELDFLNDEFDRIEVLRDSNYVDITEYWASFQPFISSSWLIGYKPAGECLPTEPHDESDYCFKFYKDNEVYYAAASDLSHNSFGGSDRFYVLYNDVVYEYQVSNIALFHRAFAPAQEAEALLSDNAILLEPSIYNIMSDSVLLIRKMTYTDDIHYWGQEKYAVISAIANHYTKTLEQKPDDLKKYGIIRSYTYVYSSDIKIDVTLYGLSLWQKGLYAHVKMDNEEVWVTMDTCIKDIQAVLNDGSYYRIPCLVLNAPTLQLDGYDKVVLIHNNEKYDITEMWPSYLSPVGLCDWAEYMKADVLETDCRIVLEKEGEQLVIDVARTYEYAIAEGKGIYKIPYIESIIDAVIGSDLYKATDAFTDKNCLYKMLRASCIVQTDISDGNEKTYSIYKNTFEPALSLLTRYTKTLANKPYMDMYAWKQVDFFYKSEVISMTVWRITGDDDKGYVNISHDGTETWIEIHDAYIMFSFVGCDAWGNPWLLPDSASEYTMVPYNANR